MEGKGPHVQSCILPRVDVQYGNPCNLLGILGLMSAHEQLSLRGLQGSELVHNQTSFQTPIHQTQLSAFPQEAPPLQCGLCV